MWRHIETKTNPSGAVEFTGLAGYHTLRLIADRVPIPTGSFRQVQVGTQADGWLDSVGDYVDHKKSGDAADVGAMGLHDEGSASARSGQIEIGGCNINSAWKFGESAAKDDNKTFLIKTNNIIDRIRMIDSSGNNPNGGGGRVILLGYK